MVPTTIKTIFVSCLMCISLSLTVSAAEKAFLPATVRHTKKQKPAWFVRWFCCTATTHKVQPILIRPCSTTRNLRRYETQELFDRWVQYSVKN